MARRHDHGPLVAGCRGAHVRVCGILGTWVAPGATERTTKATHGSPNASLHTRLPGRCPPRRQGGTPPQTSTNLLYYQNASERCANDRSAAGWPYAG